MIGRKSAFAMLALVVGLAGTIALLGCTIQFYEGGDTNTNSIAGPSGPSPAPTASANPQGGSVATVTINAFGEACPAGVAPANQNRTVRVGCNLSVTVNPRDGAGQVIFNLAVTGGAPDYFRAAPTSSAATFTQDATNPFNGNVVGLNPGTILLEAAVRGVPSRPDVNAPPGPTTFTVVP